MTQDKRVEEMVQDLRNIVVRYGAEEKEILEVADWLRTTLTQYHQDLMSEVGKARDQEAKLWFETWYSCYIAPEKPSPGEFAKFATERIQMTGYLHDETQNIIKSK